MAAMTTVGTVTMGLSGQACVAHTRALVHRDVYDAFLGAAQMMAGAVNYGDPFELSTTASALINGRQLDRVLGFIERGRESGARLVCGGERAGGDLAAGNFVQPTIFADVDNTMEIAREEVFGPVLTVIPFSDEDEAVRIANDTEYGLSAAVFSENVPEALEIAQRIESGICHVNDTTVHDEPQMPFGGVKASGWGRFGGTAALQEFTELRWITVQQAPRHYPI